MRLLKVADDGSLSFTQDLPDKAIPKYAILSHTWGPPADEVLYHEILDGSGLAKAGFRKIRFCADQAKQDGLDHIWVDTCCINKPNLTELSEAINSMFKWYAKAEVCHVWLPDVTAKGRDQGDDAEQRLNNSMRNSRWFTRGWTLQELIAPKDVMFYSNEWAKIGDKTSLQWLISDITRIPAEALRGEPLEQFSITERLSWQDSRQTTKEEDKAYALLGICGVNLPLIYSEGQENAFRRLRNEIDNISKGANREDFAVPFAVDDVIGVENFVARQRELQEMRKFLSSDGSRRTVVIHGLGGIGKTQLMIAYAKAHRDDYSAIFWLNAKDNDSMQSSYANIARQISQVHPDARGLECLESAANADVAVNAVKNWLCLAGNTRWLLLLDNLDNPKILGNTSAAAVDFRTFLPSAQQGFVAVTTRSSRLGIGHQLNLQKIGNTEDSIKILSDSSSRNITIEDKSAVELSNKLDGLPLALATAGAYLHQSSMDLTEYLHWHSSAWGKLQKTSPGLTSYEDRMLYSTWQVSFDRVERINTLSANLLRLWAHFDNQDLWYELLCHDREEMGARPQWIIEVTQDKLTFENAVRILRDHGLVAPHTHLIKHTGSAGYSVHSCVHAWIRNVLNTDDNGDLATFAMRSVAAHVPRYFTHVHFWLVERRLLSHASFTIGDHTEQYCAERAWAVAEIARLNSNAGQPQKSEILFDMIWEDLKDADTNLPLKLVVAYGLASCCSNQGKLTKAEIMVRQALEGQEKASGLHDASTLTTKSRLAGILSDKGQFKEAKKMYSDVLLGQKEALGQGHLVSLKTATSLATVCISLGEFDEAEGLLQIAKQGIDCSYGSDHPMFLGVMEDFARLSAAKDDLDSAEATLRQVIEGQEIAFECDSSGSCSSYYNLGRVLFMRRKLTQSESIMLLALEKYENEYGHDSKKTLEEPVKLLAKLYHGQLRYGEAEQMYLRALQGLERLGSGHEGTLKPAKHLGIMCREQGRYRGAEEASPKGQEGYNTVYWPDHTETLLRLIDNLADLYEEQGLVEKAEVVFQRAARCLEQALGANHLRTIEARLQLADFYGKQGKLHEAEGIYLPAWRGLDLNGGRDTREAKGRVMRGLGNIYIDQKRAQDAEESYLKSVQEYEAAFGLYKSGAIVIPLEALAILYDDQGRSKEAGEMYLRCLRFEECLDSVDEYHAKAIARWKYKLGRVYIQEKRLEEAESMLLQALQDYEVAHGQDHAKTLNNPVSELADLYCRQGRVGEAEAMYQRALRGLVGRDEKTWLAVLTKFADVLHKESRSQEAEGVLLQALTRFEVADRDSCCETRTNPAAALLKIHSQLADIYDDEGRSEEAADMYSRFLRNPESGRPDEQKNMARTMYNLSRMYARLNKSDEEHAMLIQALEAFETAYGQDHRKTLRRPVLELGLFYAEQGDLEAAEQMYRRALPARDRMSANRQEQLDDLGESIEKLRQKQGADEGSLSASTQACSEQRAGIREMPLDGMSLKTSSGNEVKNGTGAENIMHSSPSERRLYQDKGQWMVAPGLPSACIQVSLDGGHGACLQGKSTQATSRTSTTQAEIIRLDHNTGRTATQILLSLRPRRMETTE